MRNPFRRRTASPPSTDATMTLTEHLSELRFRIIRSMLAVALGAILIIVFYDHVLDFLLGPYDNLCDRRGAEFCGGTEGGSEDVNRLFTLDPIEGLSTRLRVATYGGIIIALPVVLWQVWQFIVPALERNEKRYAVPFVLTSVLLFLLGGTIAYLTLERALEFLISWSGDDVGQVYQVSKYIRLVGLMVAAFGIGFLTPVLLVFLQLAGVVTPQALGRGWRLAVVVIVVLAAVITPSGDPISLLALAAPMTVLYFVAILVGWLVQRSRRRAAAA